MQTSGGIEKAQPFLTGLFAFKLICTGLDDPNQPERFVSILKHLQNGVDCEHFGLKRFLKLRHDRHSISHIEVVVHASSSNDSVVGDIGIIG